MAEVRISDVIDVEVFQDLEPVNTTRLKRIVSSGLVFASGLLNTLADAPTSTPELPFWNDLDQDDEVNYSNDDPTDEGETSKVTQGVQKAQRAHVNKGWTTMNLANELTMGANAMEHIRNRTDGYFMSQLEKRITSSSLGIMADSVANHDSDMVVDVASESIAGQTAQTRFSRQVFVAGAFTSGDHFDNYVAIGVHSMVFQQMVDQEDVEDVRDSEGNLVFQTYMGRRIIVDDSHPIIPGTTDGNKYVSVLYGSNAIGMGNGSPTRPVEVASNPSAGNGAGSETLWVRKTWLLHPFGYQSGATVTAAVPTPTRTQLEAAATWTRVIDRKLVPMAFIITN